MAVVNYLRVSSSEQNPDRQLATLPQADKQFIEKASGSSVDRPELQEMFNYIRTGDRINVHSIDRLARNIVDLNNIVRQVLDAGCVISFQKENMTFGNGENEAISRLLFNVLGSFAEFERTLIKERQKEGIEAAKKKGIRFGRPGKLTDAEKDEIRKRNKNGINPTELGKEYGVSRGTIYNILKGQ